VDFERVSTLYAKDKDRFFWLSEDDGYNHIYLYNRRTGKRKQITRGNWEVTDFYGYSPRQKRLFYQSTATGSTERSIWSVNEKGKNYVLLSPEKGYASADFSGDYRYFIKQYSNASTPPVYEVAEFTGRGARTLYTLIDNKALREKLKNYRTVEKQFTRLPSADPAWQLNAYFYYPPGFTADSTYPVLIYQYNGPGVQTVLNAWGRMNDFYHQMLAQEGFIVVSVDTRGTGGRGTAFRQIPYKQLGIPEQEDLRAVGAYLKSLPYTGKLGVWGWSYGGFMAANTILRSGDVFDMAIAVAPVTDWRFYDTVYTERYMQTPDANPDGYDETAPLHLTEWLQKPLLLIHGTADDNVHVQNAYELARRLQEDGKKFQMHIYPDKNHGIYGGKTRLQLYRLMYDFTVQNLKN